MSEDGTSAILVVSESDNTCDELSAMSDGSYEEAAFMVELTGWDDVDPGDYGVTGSSPSVDASAYVVAEDESGEPIAEAYGLDGAAGYVNIIYVNPGETLDFYVNFDESDDETTTGAEGSGNACYCEDLDGFSFPSGGGGDIPDPDEGGDEGSGDGTCSDDSDCPLSACPDGSTSCVCGPGFCVPGCDSASDCPSGFSCDSGICEP
jgi:hypothetical protein